MRKSPGVGRPRCLEGLVVGGDFLDSGRDPGRGCACMGKLDPPDRAQFPADAAGLPSGALMAGAGEGSDLLEEFLNGLQADGDQGLDERDRVEAATSSSSPSAVPRLSPCPVRSLGILSSWSGSLWCGVVWFLAKRTEPHGSRFVNFQLGVALRSL